VFPKSIQSQNINYREDQKDYLFLPLVSAMHQLRNLSESIKPTVLPTLAIIFNLKKSV
jgi:hypothetical protein